MDIHTYCITLAWQFLMYSPTGIYRFYLSYHWHNLFESKLLSLFCSGNCLGISPSTCTSCSLLLCLLKYSITCVLPRTLRAAAFCGCDFWCNTWPWHNERKSVYPSSWSTQSNETCFLKVSSKSFWSEKNKVWKICIFTAAARCQIWAPVAVTALSHVKNPGSH